MTFMPNKISQSQKDKHCMIPFLGGTWSSQIQREEKEWRLPGAGGGRDEELVFNGSRVSVLQDEKGSGDGCHNHSNTSEWLRK